MYFGKIADADTHLLRNAALAGVLSRSTSGKVNPVNAMQIAEQRRWHVAEGRERRSVHTDSIRLESETDRGVSTVEGAVFLEKPRLTQETAFIAKWRWAGSWCTWRNCGRTQRWSSRGRWRFGGRVRRV